ncbi:nucleotidyltransferase family protein [Megalodesulfovibrio gigas]|uniref:Putative nucleotidyl transferase n=1 Tax=Megalodesulfovibrio gigas (strain ATCC 19364 / DSM 1382 / NCIMB 9332 / VKM B-1759) TaxID=1121448 RepID=T2GBP8_MEGG1|nr:NDP-sugar synthase [Megalodesulfovibrio gigas]AGW13546.1 putative nucleotidyl transferase [Megalodesulfovibrio gigas DSM 1382 = ATCC 19364]
MEACVFLAPRLPLPPAMGRQSPFWLLPLANRPLLLRMLEGLTAGGITRCHLLHDPGDLEAIELVRGRLPEDLTVEWMPRGEGTLMETLTRLRGHLGEDFLVLPFPHLTGPSLRRLLDEHHRQRNACTVVAGESNHKPPASAPKLFCCNQAVLGLPATLGCDDFTSLAKALVDAGARVGVCEAGVAVAPLEGLVDFHKCVQRILRKELEGADRPGVRLEAGVFVGRHCTIHPTARLRAPVLLGDGCRIGRDAEIGPGACLAPGTVVERASALRDTVVLGDCVIGPRHHVDRAVIQAGLLIRMPDLAMALAADPHFLGAQPANPPLDILNVLLQRVLAAALLVLCSPLLLVMYALHLAQPRKRLICMATVSGEAREGADGKLRLRRFRMRTFSSQRLFLRHLPSLWDVVMGQLRLVGTEPLPPRSAGLLREPWQRVRFLAPVGLVPPWARLRGIPLTFTQKRVMEQEYTLCRTVRGDLRILCAALLQGLPRQPETKPAARRATNVLCPEHGVQRSSRLGSLL